MVCSPISIAYTNISLSELMNPTMPDTLVLSRLLASYAEGFEVMFVSAKCYNYQFTSVIVLGQD